MRANSFPAATAVCVCDRATLCISSAINFPLVTNDLALCNSVRHFYRVWDSPDVVHFPFSRLLIILCVPIVSMFHCAGNVINDGQDFCAYF